jgi:hypothetical protein
VAARASRSASLEVNLGPLRVFQGAEVGYEKSTCDQNETWHLLITPEVDT